MASPARRSRVWSAAVLLALVVVARAAADGPLLTQDAQTEEYGVLIAEVGLGVREEARDFGVANRERQLDLGKLRIAAGLGPFVEAQVSGIGVLVIEETDGTGTNSGDWSLGTKIRLLAEKGRRPAIGVLGEVKLPVASDDRGGATDETDFAGLLLLSRGLGERYRLHLNLGAELLGNPGANAAQNDVLLARLGAQRRVGRDDLIALELLVQDGPASGDSPRSLRGIYLRRVGRWAFQAGLAVGLSDDADDAALDLGVRRTLRWGGER